MSVKTFKMNYLENTLIEINIHDQNIYFVFIFQESSS